MSTAQWISVSAIATAIMAAATLVLAFKTRSMARETKAVGMATLKEAEAVEAQVKLTESQIQISTTTLQVSVRPWLVWEPTFESDSGNFMGMENGELYMPGSHSALQVREEAESVTGWMRLRNVGNGLAILDMSRSWIYPRNRALAFDTLHPSVETPVVPVGAFVDVHFKIPPSVAVGQQKMTIFELAGGDGLHHVFTIEVTCLDALNQSPVSVKFRATRDVESEEWSIYETEYPMSDGSVVRARRSAPGSR